MIQTKTIRWAAAKRLIVALLCSFGCTMGYAQYARSTYFMDGSVFRQQLNPALTPDQGYVNIPVIGAFNASVSSNSLGISGVQNVIGNSSDDDYFLDDAFINRLKADNKLNINLSTDILSAGWYKGQGFWTANLGIKVDAGAVIPQRLFGFLRDTRGADLLSWLNYDMSTGSSKAEVNSYIEAAAGYSHPIGKRLTVGGKVKMLFGIANIKMDIRNLSVQTGLTGINPQQDWTKITLEELKNVRGHASITSDATIEASMKGFEMRNGNDGLVKDIRREGSLGVAGVGLGVDLGAAYKVSKDITVSASLLDIGFISWSKSNSYKAVSNVSKQYRFDTQHLDEAKEFQQLMADGELLNIDLLQTKQSESRGRTTSLYTSLVLGGEYRLLDDKLSLGLLSTTRFTQPKAISELTLSSAYKVNKMLGFSLTYSILQSGGSGLGIGMRLGPVTIATDYMYFSSNSRCVNALLGISIPLGSARNGNS